MSPDGVIGLKWVKQHLAPSRVTYAQADYLTPAYPMGAAIVVCRLGVVVQTFAVGIQTFFTPCGLSRDREQMEISRECFVAHTYPADTQRNNNVIMTSERRHDVVLTLLWRYYWVMCPLGSRMDG